MFKLCRDALADLGLENISDAGEYYFNSDFEVLGEKFIRLNNNRRNFTEYLTPIFTDCSAVRYVCECISRRAGFMVSAGVTALLKKMDYHDVVVAIDGSVFRFHPHFPNIMKSRISQLMGIDYKFDLMLSLDGSGRGAALVAAVLQGQCAV